MTIYKKTVLVILSVAIAFLPCISGCSKKTDSVKENKSGKVNTEYSEIAASDGILSLYSDDFTELLLDSNGFRIGFRQGENYLWTAPDYDELNNLSAELAEEIRSHLVIEYYDSQNNKKTMNSYTDSVLKNQYKLYRLENGCRIEYVLGYEETVMLYPEAITLKTMEEDILPKLSESESEKLLSYYIKTVYADTDKQQRRILRNKYSEFGKTDMYVSNSVSVKIQKKIGEILKKTGFTAEDMEAEYRELGYAANLRYNPSFKIPVEYTVCNNELKVSIPCDQIEYDSANFKITKISVLPYFGAAPSSDNGYIFMPDGSGILINLDNTTTGKMSVKVYGEEVNISKDRLENGTVQSCYLPVWGIKNGNTAWMCVIEDGAALAEISAETAAGQFDMNYAYSTFSLLERLSYKSDGLVIGTEFVRYGKTSYQGRISLSYCLLTGDDADYMGMAKTYKSKAFADSVSPEFNGRLVIDSYAVIKHRESFLNFSINKDTALTTIAQLSEIINDIDYSGKIVNYKNFQTDEFYNEIKGNNKPNRLIDKEMTLEDFYAKNIGEEDSLFLSKQILFTDKGRSGEFSSRDDLMRTTENAYATDLYNKYSTDTYRLILNNSAVKKALKKLESISCENISTGYMLSGVGRYLATDYGEDNYSTRQDMLNTLTASVSELSEQKKLANDAAGMYVSKYFSLITDLPDGGSGFKHQDAEIPFLQLVLNGNVSYCSTSFNETNDSKSAFLKTIENGGLPHYTLNYGDAMLLHGSQYANLNRTQYSVVKDEMKSQIKKYAEFYKSIENASITDHQIENGLRIVGYSNGKTVIVNYTDYEKEYSGVKIRPMDYAVV